MTRLRVFFASLFVRSEEIPPLFEYAIVLALVAIIAIIGLIYLNGQVTVLPSTLGNSV